MDTEQRALMKAQQVMDAIHAEAMLIPEAADDDDEWEPQTTAIISKEAEEWQATLARLDMIEKRLADHAS